MFTVGRRLALAGGLALLLVGCWVGGAPGAADRSPARKGVACRVYPQGFSACYAPGTTQDHLRDLQLRLGLALPSGAGAYSAGRRWLETATDGLVGGDDTITLTYSFVPDGDIPTTAFQGITELPNTLFETLNGEFGSPQAWQAIVAEIFSHWSTLTGVKYVLEPNDDGASWPSAEGILGVRGDVRIIAVDADGPSGLLALNFFPSLGDMMLDANEAWGDSRNDFVFLRNVMLHEHGHGLGLGHVVPLSETKLMEPFYSEAFFGPQDDDIRGANLFYGDRFESNGSAGTAASLGQFSEGRIIDNLSLHARTDADWYSLTVPAGTLLGIDVIPVGSTYVVGPTDVPNPPPPQSINTTTVQRLSIEVRNSTGTTVLGAAEAAAPGEEANVSGVDVGSGAVRIKVFSAPTGSVSDVQRYQLRMLERAVLPRTLRIQSAPTGGVAITYSPQDLSGGSGATSNAERTFASGASVTLTAPATFNGEPLGRWKLDGQNQPVGQRDLTVQMNRDHTVIADYSDALIVDAGADRKVVIGGQVALSAVAVGGAPPYTFRWTPAGSLTAANTANPIASPLQTTTYTVTVTDNLGTEEVDEVTVQVVPRLSVNLGDRVPVAAGLPFTIVGNVAGGIEPYEFAWSPLAAADRVQGASLTTVADAAKRFTLTVTDSSAARASDSVDVEIAKPLTAELGPDLTVLKNTTLRIEARLSEGVKPYTIIWSTNAKLVSADGLSATVTPEATSVYRVIATDAVGQSAVAEQRIVVASPVSLRIQADPAMIGSGNSSTLTAVVEGGAPPFTIRWAPANLVSDAAALTTVASPPSTTTFACTVQDALNQVATAELEIKVSSGSNLLAGDDTAADAPSPLLGGPACGTAALTATLVAIVGMMLTRR
ncbi:Matrixin [Phycisphaerae bacterium RAS1]|nr:Matrixin [Phycisphaerae bacterium RAS1]